MSLFIYNVHTNVLRDPPSCFDKRRKTREILEPKILEFLFYYIEFIFWNNSNFLNTPSFINNFRLRSNYKRTSFKYRIR